MIDRYHIVNQTELTEGVAKLADFENRHRTATNGA